MNKNPDEAELREKLDPQQYIVTQEGGTEPAFSGKYWNEKADGMYHCVVCDQALFSSDTKFESGSGWPSFFEPVNESAVVRKSDKSHGMVRTEVCCGNCGAHLGHVFDDGPNPSGERHCINSAALDLSESD